MRAMIKLHLPKSTLNEIYCLMKMPTSVFLLKELKINGLKRWSTKIKFYWMFFQEHDTTYLYTLNRSISVYLI